MPSLKRNFSWSFSGNVVYAVTQWGVLTALVRVGTPDLVGQYTVALALSGPVYMFTNLQLASVIATDSRQAYRFGDYLGLRLLTSLLALVLVCGIAFGTEDRWDTRLLVVTIGLSKLFESMSDVCYGLFQQRERMDQVSISQVSRGLLGFSVLAVLLKITGNVIAAALGMAMVWAGVLLLYDIPRTRSLLRTTRSSKREAPRPIWSPDVIAKIVWLAFPLGIVSVLDSLITNIPRYFIRHYAGPAEVGYFSAVSYLMVAGGTFVGAMVNSVCPRLAQYYHDNRRAFRGLTLKLTAIGLGIGLVGVVGAALVGRLLLTLLYRVAYAQFQQVFLWLMVAAAIWYTASCVGVAITAARYFRVQAPLYSASAFATVVGSYVWVPSHGMLGAAWALCLGMLVRLAGSGFVLAHALRTASQIAISEP